LAYLPGLVAHSVSHHLGWLNILADQDEFWSRLTFDMRGGRRIGPRSGTIT
jgi:hypothetical protein